MHLYEAFKKRAENISEKNNQDGFIRDPRVRCAAGENFYENTESLPKFVLLNDLSEEVEPKNYAYDMLNFLEI